MKFKKTICALAMAMAVGGCNAKNHLYDFNGEIDGEKVEFVSEYHFSVDDNNLTVTRTDGTLVKYTDNYREDDKIESVCITPPNVEEKCFYDNAVGQETLAEAQTQFDGYLAKILDYKQKEGMKLIKPNTVEDIKE